jgi:hypothetical protein
LLLAHHAADMLLLFAALCVSESSIVVELCQNHFFFFDLQMVLNESKKASGRYKQSHGPGRADKRHSAIAPQNAMPLLESAYTMQEELIIVESSSTSNKKWDGSKFVPVLVLRFALLLDAETHAGNVCGRSARTLSTFQYRRHAR